MSEQAYSSEAYLKRLTYSHPAAERIDQEITILKNAAYTRGRIDAIEAQKVAMEEARAALYGCREVLGDIANIGHAIQLLDDILKDTTQENPRAKKLCCSCDGCCDDEMGCIHQYCEKHGGYIVNGAKR